MKNLLFVSSYSTLFAFDNIFSSFNLVSVLLSNVLSFLSILSFNRLILLASDESASSFLNCVITFVNVCFPVYVSLPSCKLHNLLVTVPFISSKNSK